MTIVTPAKLPAPKQFSLPIYSEATIKWTSPRVVEIAVGLEINSYACAARN